MPGEKTYKVLGSGEQSGFLIDDEFVEAVEEMAGVSSTWGGDDPKKILACVIAVFMRRYEVREN